MPRGRKKKGARTPASEVLKAARVDEILQLRLNGAERYDLRIHAEEQQWNISERTLTRYIAATDELIAASLEKDRPKLINRHLAQRASLYARAVGDGDVRTALAVCRDSAELLGLYPSKAIELTGPNGTALLPGELTDADARERIAVLEARLAERLGSNGGIGATESPVPPV